jgi:hypothetical protein
MSIGTTVKTYPTSVDTFITWQDDIDTILAAAVNDAYTQIIAIESELGANPSGSLSTLTARLAVSINDDGTLKGGVGQKKTITAVNANGTYAFNFVSEGLVDYADTTYKVFLTTTGTNGVKCHAVVSGAKATTGFTIALLASGTNGYAPYNASVDGGGNVTVDVFTI